MTHDLFTFLRWVYAQFIAVDANFRLKLKNRQINDPELGSGLSYFVENSAYVKHVEKNTPEEEEEEEEVRCAYQQPKSILTAALGYKLR